MAIVKQTVEMGVGLEHMPGLTVRFQGIDCDHLNSNEHVAILQSIASGMLSSAVLENDKAAQLVDMVSSTDDHAGGLIQLQILRYASEACVMVCDAVIEPGYLEKQREFMKTFARKAPELKQKFQDAADELGRKLEAMAGGEG